MQLPRKNQLEWIVWHDACADSLRAQVDMLSDLRLATNANVGWVIDEDDHRIILAHGQSTSGEVDYFAIPVANVLERNRIIPSKGRKAKSRT
ncbi:MAG: hypothetical protein KDA42_17635 [Planctomycetales bacterium]|nr:hypothetical protein [Planctomycetales bacterium]